jgi:hypothetical protein
VSRTVIGLEWLKVTSSLLGRVFLFVDVGHGFRTLPLYGRSQGRKVIEPIWDCPQSLGA